MITDANQPPSPDDSMSYEELADEYEDALEWLATHDDERFRVLGQFILERGGKR